MNYRERPLVFACEDAPLIGIACVPEKPAPRGVLIVVGGPQYRAGSHRQFTLLARYLAERGVPSLRFDYRGMGDSGGSARTFEDVGGDLRAAVDTLMANVPGLKEVVIWGLCDAASAAMFYAHLDARITGLVLLNPWVHTPEGTAKAYLKHYYLKRLVDPGLWRKVRRGEFHLGAALKSFSGLLKAAMGKHVAAAPRNAPAAACGIVPLPERMLHSFSRFGGRVLLILSGNDLTAQEFLDTVKTSRKWQKRLKSAQVMRRDLKEANHTFSRREWRDQVAEWTWEWLRA